MGVRVVMVIENEFRFRTAFLIILFGVGLALTSTNCQADIVSFQIVGNSDINLDGVFRADEDFEVVFSVDSNEPDQLPFESNRGAFHNVTVMLTLLDSGLMVQNSLALNINALRQDLNPQSLFLANESNVFNQGLAVNLPAGTILDVNQVNPLVNDNVSGTSNGQGLAWQLAGGQTLQFTRVNSLTISNFQAVPEPNVAWLLLLGATSSSLFNRRFLRG